MIDSIKKLSKKYHKDVVKMRRHMHMHPELSWEEKNTGKFISSSLKSMGILHTTGWCNHGVVAIIKGEKKSKKVIALRADMDALPILEKNKKAYKSKNDGVMHACGHDVHSASLLGSAKILHELRKNYGGTIKCIFQPAEERMPGGASILIKEGVLKNPVPTSIIGQHVHPPLKVGKVGMKEGNYMASADEIYIKVIGQGGHGALPHDCIDPVVIASEIVIALQTIISRHSNPIIPAVLTIGKINSVGGATNVVPNAVTMEGTFRTMNEKWRKKAHQLISSKVKQLAKASGAKVELNIVKGYPFLVNDEKLTAKVKSAAIEYMGKSQVVDLPIRMTAEDFSYYSQQMPGCFYRLGTGNLAKGISSPVHTDTFDIDEDALAVSTGLMSYLALDQLTN